MHVPETAAAQRSPVNRAPRRRGEENKARYPPAYIRGTLSRAADVAEDAAGVVEPPPVHLPVLLRATLAAPAATPSALLQPRDALHQSSCALRAAYLSRRSESRAPPPFSPATFRFLVKVGGGFSCLLMMNRGLRES